MARVRAPEEILVRPALVLTLVLLSASLVPLIPAASASTDEFCTTDIFQAAGACVAPGPCVTVYVGPSGTKRCVPVAELIDDPHVCTTHLFQAVGVCENADGCLALYVGPSERPLCAQTSGTYPCVYLDEQTHACYYRNADGAHCVGGIWGHYPYEACTPEFGVIGIARCVEPMDNLAVCHWTTSGGGRCVGVYVSYSSWEECVSPRGTTSGPECMPVYRAYEVASPAPGVGDVTLVQRSSCSPVEVYYDGERVVGP